MQKFYNKLVMKLGVNIDHVATLRQARKGLEPDPIKAALVCEKAGADSIVCHLREDRRHINDRDLSGLKRAVTTRLNLEMSVNPQIVAIACRIRPNEATLVPERRREVTTEGGLDLISQKNNVGRAIKVLQAEGITVSLFIDPKPQQIKMAKILGADYIELHTGEYSLSKSAAEARSRLGKLKAAARLARSLGLRVNAGHGLNYENVRPVAGIVEIAELNIGHSIISRAVFMGLGPAVKEMLRLIR